MKKFFYVTLFALSISLVFNVILFFKNAEFRYISHRCLSKSSPTDWYNQHQFYANNNDKELAELCLSVSAQLDYAEAQFKLAQLLMSEGKEKLAEFWMIEAAKQGNAEHQYQLGRCYDYVFSWESDAEKNKFRCQAFIWYEKAAVQNHASAAEYWYKKAMELGENVNRGLAEVYIEMGRPELAAPLLSIEAAAGSIQSRNILDNLPKS